MKSLTADQRNGSRCKCISICVIRKFTKIMSIPQVTFHPVKVRGQIREGSSSGSLIKFMQQNLYSKGSQL